MFVCTYTTTQSIDVVKSGNSTCYLSKQKLQKPHVMFSVRSWIIKQYCKAEKEKFCSLGIAVVTQVFVYIGNAETLN